MLKTQAMTAFALHTYKEEVDHVAYFSNEEVVNKLFKKTSFVWGKIFFGREREDYDAMGCDLEAVHFEPECAARLFSV